MKGAWFGSSATSWRSPQAISKSPVKGGEWRDESKRPGLAFERLDTTFHILVSRCGGVEHRLDTVDDESNEIREL